jgi:hypothetical protein
MEDRPDLRRLEPLTGEVGARHVVVRVDRLRYGGDPLHAGTELVRSILAAGRPDMAAAADLSVEQAQTGPRIGFTGRPIPEPRGALTGLDTGGSGGTGFPSATLP